jgi:hypothetical protein
MLSSDSSPRRALGRFLLAILALCALAAVSARNRPAARPLAAAAAEFSAARAQQVIATIARAPHPAESDELARVRELLLEELRASGFSTQEQRGEIRGTQLTNVLALIPGSAPTGTLLCLAHYDSVPSSPGAGDDSIGVACWLEVFRALAARGWKPRNDVLLLLSDGEELGMLGARLFRDQHPQMGAVQCVINLEAIGNGGPAVLFELGAQNGKCVEAFARSVSAPTGTSLGDAVYRRMPNNTDLTVFLERGVAGFNLAITSGSCAYHAPHDTPENLDPVSVQHMGECALSLTEEMGMADLRAMQAADVTFFDLLGYGLVRYSRAWDVALVLLGCALAIGLCFRARVSARDVTWQLLRHAVDVALLAATVGASWWCLDALMAWFSPPPQWIAGNTTSGALLFVGALGFAVAFELWRGRASVPHKRARAAVILLVWAVASLAALRWLPGSSFVFSWPLVFAALGAWVATKTVPSRTGELLHALCFAAALLLGLPILYLLLQLFQRAPLSAVVLVAATLASASGLFALSFQRIARDVPWAFKAVLLAGVLALLTSTFVARVLEWRQGALLP